MEHNTVIDLHGVSLYHVKDIFKEARFNANNRDIGELVLSDINFRVAEGEVVYLIGRVGSGKSTLLKTLYAELPLLEGEGTVAGYDLRKLRRKEVPFLRRRMGIVFQDCQLLTDRNAHQNLRFVLRATDWTDEKRINERIGEVLEAVNLSHKEHKMPFQLSGGEQQRLAIARSLLNNPQVILADEPTGNLDPAAADEVMQLFMSIARRGCAVVMSTHNIANIQGYPSRTMRLNQGAMQEIDIQSILGI